MCSLSFYYINPSQYWMYYIFTFCKQTGKTFYYDLEPLERFMENFIKKMTPMCWLSWTELWFDIGMMSFPSLAKSTSTLDFCFFQKVSLKQQHWKTTFNPSLQSKNDNYILSHIFVKKYLLYLIKKLQQLTNFWWYGFFQFPAKLSKNCQFREIWVQVWLLFIVQNFCTSRGLLWRYFL